jgi:GAF domain-containing protein
MHLQQGPRIHPERGGFPRSGRRGLGARHRWPRQAEAETGSPAAYAFQTEQPVITNHLEKEKRFRTPELLLRHGVKRAVNVLIRAGGERFGVLEVDAPDEGEFTGHDQSFLQGFANMIGVAMSDNVRKTR